MKARADDSRSGDLRHPVSRASGVEESVIVYDATLKRPACVLLQAVLGGTDFILHDFPSETWLLGPTPDMKRYLVSRETKSESRGGHHQPLSRART